MKNLRLRTKLLAIALPPLAILAVLVAYALKTTSLDPEAVDPVALQADLRTLGLVGLAGVLGSALVLVLVTRDVVGPLARLTRAADELSQERLPALIEVLRDPAAVLPPPAEPLDRGSDDELGRLARALDGVRAVAAEVGAAQQGLVHQGLSTLVVNLARRNQTLLERQLTLIDELETLEPDPARLHDLYRLDHLATRMRRNAESLLVLAGAPPPRRRGEPVALADVLRVATGEIEDYQRVELGDVDDVALGPTAAVDLAHLLSELLENATQFSAPDTAVVVGGRADLDGSYRITVTDHGIGMVEQQRLDANQCLAEPPTALGLEVSRSLGFLVVGRLAQRLGVTVVLEPSSPQGLTAVVDVPAELLGALGSPLDVGRPSAPSHRASTDGPGPVDAGPGTEVTVARDRPRPAPGPSLPVLGPGIDEAGPAPSSEPRPSIDPGSWWTHPSQQGRIGAPTGPADPSRPAYLEGPHHLAEALPSGEAFDEGLLGLITPGRPAVPAPIEPPIAPVVAFPPPRRSDERFPPAPPAAPGVQPAPAVAGADGPFGSVPSGAPVPAEPTARGADGPFGSLPPVPGEPTAPRTDSGLTRRQRGTNAPALEPGRTAGPSTRSPEEIREMLARYRRGIKHRRPATGTTGDTADEEATP